MIFWRWSGLSILQAVFVEDLLAGFSTATAAELEQQRNRTYWEGELMGMRSRKILALSEDRVVFCFARRDGGGCRAAIGSASSSFSLAASGADSSDPGETLFVPTTSALMSDPRLLPGLEWGETRSFYDAGAERVEVERLDDDRFVVCFERSLDHVIGCAVGLVTGGALAPFQIPLDLGPGRLVSTSIAAAGRRFAVCSRPAIGAAPAKSSGGERSADSTDRLVAQAASNTVCRWAQLAGGSAVKPKWTSDAPLMAGAAYS